MSSRFGRSDNCYFNWAWGMGYGALGPTPRRAQESHWASESFEFRFFNLKIRTQNLKLFQCPMPHNQITNFAQVGKAFSTFWLISPMLY